MSSNKGKHSGLGRGLASLIPEETLAMQQPSPRRARWRLVPVDEIVPNPEQPRTHFDNAELAELGDSIRTHGMLSPLVVRKHEGQYVLIAGERRLRAAAMAGLSEVPVVVREAKEPALQLELALVENLQRSDLDPVEAARGYQRLIDHYGYTQGAVARKVGLERSTIANAIRLLALPRHVLRAVRQGLISAGHARALLPLVGSMGDLRRTLAKVIAQQLSVRSTERLVASLVRAHPEVPDTDGQNSEDSEPTMAYANKLLTDVLQTMVNIKPRKRGGGRIVIDYADAQELDRLIEQLRGEPTR